jgi:hypothetical protein
VIHSSSVGVLWEHRRVFREANLAAVPRRLICGASAVEVWDQGTTCLGQGW